MAPETSWLSAVLLIACSLLCSSDARPVLVYSIQRHGARNILPKTSDLKESEATGGPTLLPQGQRQCFDAGLAFQQRYINASTCAASGTCLAADQGATLYGVATAAGVGFSNYNLLANSSALDRTIMSADAFFSGVFAGGVNTSYLALVPVYSVADSEDWRIRGYTKCPVYQARLDAWFTSSPEFKAKEQQTADFRARIQQLAPQLNTSLANWFNVFDEFWTYQNYLAGDPTPPVDSDTFAEIVDIANWLETAKMSPDLTGNLLGGGLLGDMLVRFAAAEAAVTAGSSNYHRLLSVSSHYNTQLGLLSALQSQQATTDYPWQHKIPSTAAVLVFELHTGPEAAASGPDASSSTQPAGTWAVKAVYQEGPKARYAVLPLPCAVAGDEAEQLAGPGSCTLHRFRALAGPQALNASRDWCEACNNSKVLACQLAKLQAEPRQPGAAAATVNTRSPGMIFVWCLVSVLAAALLVGIGVVAARAMMSRRRSKQQGQAGETLVAGDVL